MSHQRVDCDKRNTPTCDICNCSSVPGGPGGAAEAAASALLRRRAFSLSLLRGQFLLGQGALKEGPLLNNQYGIKMIGKYVLPLQGSQQSTKNSGPVLREDVGERRPPRALLCPQGPRLRHGSHHPGDHLGCLQIPVFMVWGVSFPALSAFLQSNLSL